LFRPACIIIVVALVLGLAWWFVNSLIWRPSALIKTYNAMDRAASTYDQMLRDRGRDRYGDQLALDAFDAGVDAWGNALHADLALRSDDSVTDEEWIITITSYGRDGVAGTSDDIVLRSYYSKDGLLDYQLIVDPGFYK